MYKFPYEKLLDHRKNLEELGRKEYLLHRAYLEDLEQELKRLFEDKARARKAISDSEIEGGAISSQISQMDDFILAQDIRIEKKREQIRVAMVEVEKAQQHLMQLARDRKTLERLKERRKAEWQKQMNKRELKRVDQLVTMRFGRNGEVG